MLGKIQNGYTMVFDLRGIDFRFGGFTFGWLAFLAALALLFFFILYRRRKRQAEKLHPLLIFFLWFLFAQFCLLNQVLFDWQKSDLAGNPHFIQKCQIFEGKVLGFVHQEAEGEITDHFQLKGTEMVRTLKDSPIDPVTGGLIELDINDEKNVEWELEKHNFYLRTPTAYNEPPAGLVKAGDEVRICAQLSYKYHTIVWMEVKNFQGKVHQYSNDVWQARLSQWLLWLVGSSKERVTPSA